MKPERRSLPLLQRLHERVFADPETGLVLQAGFARLAAELRGRSEPPHATCTIPIDLFARDALRESALGNLDPDPGPSIERDRVRLCRLFLLRRGARMAVPERHRNSVQRLVSYHGEGCIHQGVPGSGPEVLRPRAICSPATNGASAVPVDLGCHWDIVPQGVWHFPEAATDEDWATVTFHSAAEDEIVDELWHGQNHSPVQAEDHRQRS